VRAVLYCDDRKIDSEKINGPQLNSVRYSMTWYCQVDLKPAQCFIVL
jgi:hypothetical protein